MSYNRIELVQLRVLFVIVSIQSTNPNRRSVIDCQGVGVIIQIQVTFILYFDTSTTIQYGLSITVKSGINVALHNLEVITLI